MSNRTPRPDPTDYLRPCAVIDFDAPSVSQLAKRLRADTIEATIRQCFHYVRDEIKHSADFCMNPVTCKASDALEHGTGFCYAKSHLLCALLRANDIPSGLCYQRLSVDGKGPPYCLHGLVAVFLPEIGWRRIDPRGNRDDLTSEFNPPEERLPFSTNLPDERDSSQIYVEPLLRVTEALQSHDTWDSLHQDLPDAKRI